MKHRTKEELIAFETRMKGIFEEGELPYLIHWSGGNESELIKIFEEVEEGDWIFSGHRSHYHYLLAGGDPSKLEHMILRGRSMFVFDKERKFYTSSILAGTAGIAAGVAYGLKQTSWDPNLVSLTRGHCGGRPPWVWCFLGDGAEDEGHFYEAVQFASGHYLPCTFIIEDNDRSVDTNKEQRRGESSTWNGVQWPPSHVRRYHYTPTYPHGGPGSEKWVSFKAAAIARAKEQANV